MARYGSDLSHDLKKELHGDFEEVILALMLSPAVYDARYLHKAISVSMLYGNTYYWTDASVELKMNADNTGLSHWPHISIFIIDHLLMNELLLHLHFLVLTAFINV